jgi:rare lipoprotein A
MLCASRWTVEDRLLLLPCPPLRRLAARCAIALLGSALAGAGGTAFAQPGRNDSASVPASTPAAARSQRHHHTQARHVQVGKASVYSHRFAGKPMADGAPMDPHDDNAASKTLPLGTRARVTNLENGRSATVTIEDRGPYVKGRIIDLSPATAQRLGIDHREGVAEVKVAPVSPPPVDGGAPSSAGGGIETLR